MHGSFVEVRLSALVKSRKVQAKAYAHVLLWFPSSAKFFGEYAKCDATRISTKIWGTPEAVSTPSAGVLMKRRDAGTLRMGWVDLMKSDPSRAATRMHAEKFTWADITRGQLNNIFQAIEAVSKEPQWKHSS